MSNPFSSALSYLGYGGSGKNVSEAASRFVGQVIDLGGESKLKVKKVIAEGGYGYVFVAQDTQTGVDYALKRQVVSKENIKVVKREIAYLRQLRDHPHVINYVASAGIPPSHTSHGSAEFLIQTELCSGGQMEVVLRNSHLTPAQVLRVFYATCSAVAHMHSQKPPIIHRDLKVENLLLTEDGVIKLCDFGSATSEQLHPDSSWTSIQRGLAEDEIQQNTTPMYRSPEMIDLYSNQPVNECSDVWALGCMLYLLCFRAHPFEDSGKLRIINANYKLPESDNTFVMFHKIIESCLVVDPGARPSVDALLAQLYSIADHLGENIEQPSLDLLNMVKQEPEKSQDGEGDPDGSDGGGGVSAAFQSTSQQAQKLFGFMKEGAGSLFKNIKDSSSKAISAMSAAAPRRGGLDVTYVTSRIIAMSYPHEDSFHSHNIGEVHSFLEERHPSAYLVFNLSGNSYDPAKLGNQVYDFNWPQRGVPELEKLVDLCRSMDSWLRAEPTHVIVVHCHDGLTTTPLAVVAYLLFLRVVTSPLAALNFVALKRRPEAPAVVATPSQLRYLDGMARLVTQPPYKPHACKLTVVMLRLTTVPLFNAIRTGCKPFVEVFQEGERVYTSASHESMDTIRSFHMDDHCVEIPLGVTVQGNITVNVYHIRAIPVARKAGMGMTAVKMFYFHFHTGFMDIQQTSFTFDKKGLDGSSVRKKEKFPPPFHAILEGEWDTSSIGVYREASWQNLPYPKATPITCFSSTTEQFEVLKLIDPHRTTVISRRLPDIPTTPTSPPASNLVPLLDSQQQQLPVSNLVDIQEEEYASVGGGNLIGGGGGVHQASQPGVPSDEIFGNLGGYVQFEDQASSEGKEPRVGYSGGSSTGSSSSSSSSSGGGGGSSSGDEDFNGFRGIQFGAHPENLYAQPAKLRAKNKPADPTHQTVSDQLEMEKLIEFGTEEDVENIELGTSSHPMGSSTGSAKSSRPENGKSDPPDAFAGVVFDPWGTFSSPEESSGKANAGTSSIEDMLGLGGSAGGAWKNATSGPATQSAATDASAQLAGLGQNQQTSFGFDPFDPFGSSQTTSAPSTNGAFGTTASAPSASTAQASSNVQSFAGNGSGGQPNDPFGMLGGDAPLLAPMNSSNTLSSSSSTNTSPSLHASSARTDSHRLSEPFAVFGSSLLNPSSDSTGSSMSSRKMSTPDPQQFARMQQQHQHQHGPMFGSSLTPTHQPKSSFSHPNLTSAGQNLGMYQGRGGTPTWNQSYGTGTGKGGSMSQNTSPRRSPSPMSASRSSENVNQGKPGKQASYDPFNQFNIKNMSEGQAQTQGQSSSAAHLGMATASAPRMNQTSGLPPTGNNYRPYYMQNQGSQSGSSQRASSAGTSRSNGSIPASQKQGVGSKPKASSAFQNRPQSPNYNPSYSTVGNKTGMPTKPKADAFGDLLGSGFNPKKNDGPKTLKGMKSNQDITNSLDPERAQVAAWAERKERNIRAILSSLHEVLWEGESRWHEVGMHQLVQPEQVSKFYRKACLSVHPDKAQGTEHESLARAIFDELNDAYAKFEASGSRPLY